MTPARLHRSSAPGARLADQCTNPAGWVCVNRPGPWGNLTAR